METLMETTPQLTGIHQMPISNGTWPNRHLMLIEFENGVEIINEVGDQLSPSAVYTDYGHTLQPTDLLLVWSYLDK